ncbi:MAG TPA: glycosyltransferase [Bryobacteraceae bacterium]|nr:glycosyltransferase [Bryobacteraceae bacterium]
MIPKLIIQTGPPNLPVLLRSAIVNVKLLHPEFEHRFFDDAMIESFVAECFPEYLNDYHSFRFRIQKYDFFRYLAIFQFGGFYLDLDVFLAKDLTPLIESECVFPFEELAEGRYFWDELRMDWHIGNYAFGAEPRHPFLAAVIANCLRAKHEPEWVRPMMKGIPGALRSDFYVLNSTGPGLISRTLAENPELAGRINILFPEDVLDRSAWHHFGAYGVHNMTGSWRRPAKFLDRIQTRIWNHLTLRRILGDARARGRTRDVRTLLRTSA